jgi:hypothetical protein
MGLYECAEIGTLSSAVHQPNRYFRVIHIDMSNGLHDLVLLFGRIMFAVANQLNVGANEVNAAPLNVFEVLSTTVSFIMGFCERPLPVVGVWDAQWGALVFAVFGIVCDDPLLQVGPCGWDDLVRIHDGAFDVRLRDDLVRSMRR